MIPAVVIALVLVHSPNGDLIEINPDQIVSLRAAAPGKEEVDRLYHKSVKCLIITADGKSIPAVESCEVIKVQIQGAK
jgi:hypothetical protein